MSPASPELLRRLGHNLRSWRCRREYTQERLGEICGFGKQYISDIENANVNITLGNLERLATGLGCSETDLLSRWGHP